MCRFRRSGFVGVEGAIAVWYWGKGDRVLGGEGRSLFDLREIGDRVCG